MKPFMDQDFLLSTPTAVELFHRYAAPLPIIDYHCHIDAAEIYENRTYENLAQAWLGGDHYKWRAMRICGVEERLITGNAADREKFNAFCGIMPKLAGSPLYHWAHLELKNYFGITTPLSAETAEQIWQQTAEQLQKMPVREVLARSGVEALCTTNDPTEDLKYHRLLAEDSTFAPKVYPAFRPDRAIAIDKPGFTDYLAQLGACCGVEIHSIAALQKALLQRVEFFNQNGCRACDHGLDYVPFYEITAEQAEQILQKALRGQALTKNEVNGYKTFVQQFLVPHYKRLNWVWEVHFGVMRNVNSAQFAALGADTGFDTAGHRNDAEALAQLLNSLYQKGALPKTILFPINPADNITVGTLCGAFCCPGAAGFVQQGAAWWFNDTKNGMEQQLKSFSELSVLGCFVGMLTDSRSFFSYPRHEYFRRIFCNYLGNLVENGEYPNSPAALKQLVEGVCYGNAKKFFNLE